MIDEKKGIWMTKTVSDGEVVKGSMEGVAGSHEIMQTALAQTAEYALAVEALPLRETELPLLRKSAYRFLRGIYGDEIQTLPLDESNIDLIVAHIESLRSEVLPEKYRQRTRLFLRGMSYQEIADELKEVSDNAVQVFISLLKTRIANRETHSSADALAALRLALETDLMPLTKVSSTIEPQQEEGERNQEEPSIPEEVKSIEKLIEPVAEEDDEEVEFLSYDRITSMVSQFLKLDKDQRRLLGHFLDPEVTGMQHVNVATQAIIDTIRETLKTHFGSLSNETLALKPGEGLVLRQALGWYHVQNKEKIYPAKPNREIVRTTANLIDYRRMGDAEAAFTKLARAFEDIPKVSQL